MLFLLIFQAKISVWDEEDRTAIYILAKGKIYDKKPFKIKLKPDKSYLWCMCGQSHSQVHICKIGK